MDISVTLIYIIYLRMCVSYHFLILFYLNHDIHDMSLLILLA